MKRTMAKIFALFCAFLLLTSCSGQPTVFPDAEDFDVAKDNEAGPATLSTEALPQAVSWQEAYAALLLEYKEKSEDLFFYTT